MARGGESMGLWKRFVKEEDAIATVEIVLIIVVLVGLVVIFKRELVNLVEDIMKSITKKGKGLI